jgi:Bacterial Ig-like domain (group 3)
MSTAKIRMFAGVAAAGASLALTGAVCVVAMSPAAAAAALPVLGHWAKAGAVPGMAALTSSSSTVSAVYCAPSADCAIGGTYDDALGNPQAWVASGHAGTWANAIALPGSITTGGGHSAINEVSCATGNYCVAVGETSTDQLSDRATVDVDLFGTWQQAMFVPGLDASSSQALSVSCPSVGNCTVVGWYRDASNAQQPFVEDEVNGTWGFFQPVGNLSRINTGQLAELNSVSCRSPGNCTAAGEYTILGGGPQAFLVAEVSGTWHLGGPVIFALPPSTGRAVSCPASGECALTGTSADVNGHTQVYVLGTTTGDLAEFQFPPGSVDLNVGGTALVNSVSCASDGNCVLVGHYTDATGRWQPFIAEETGGTWQNTIPVPAIATLDVGHFSDLQSVSCPTAGNCAALGFYTDASGNEQVLTTDEVNGTWGSAAKLPGQSNQGIFFPQSHVSCWSAGNCVTGGVIAAPTGLQAIVSVESPAASATLATNTATVRFGQEQAATLTINVKHETGGIPAGQVTLSAGQTTLAVVTLKRGKATWTFPPKKLRPGTYQLTASYASSNGYDPVTSAKKKFVVTR